MSADSPIHRVPPEVLGHIVSYFPTSRIGWTADMELANIRKLPLLLLARVCSHWRAIVMHTPALWSRIELHGRYWEREKACVDATKRVLERSGGHGLDVILVLDGATDRMVRDLLDLLAPHYSRITSLDLCIEGKRLLLLESMRDKLIRLRRLYFAAPTGGNTAVQDLAIEMFHGCPQLRHVTLNSVTNEYVPQLPYHRLESLEYKDNGTAHGVATVLENLPHGSRLSFQHIAHTWTRVGFGTQVVAPTFAPVSTRISALHLDVTAVPSYLAAAECTRLFLRSLSAPNLEALSFTRHPFPALWSTDDFPLFAERSKLARSLRKLDVRRMLLTDYALLAVLADLPALEELAIGDHPLHNTGREPVCALTDALLLRLAGPNSGSSAPQLVPRLGSLDATSLFTCTVATYRDFVAARAGDVPGGVFVSNLSVVAPVKGPGREAQWDEAKMKLGEIVEVLEGLVAQGRARVYRE
ncbi:F-box domain-containing protein [Mycena chlorophos]|uniref:F-box domain-containing protein n=1 Tax=Mycena chlorophos TaxID=658473 RepID=A0A8H6S2X4_MYCCL|nr:F-box domain-containing protein [Mycena chlorophos]